MVVTAPLLWLRLALELLNLLGESWVSDGLSSSFTVLLCEEGLELAYHLLLF